MATSLVLLPYLQRWDGASLEVNLLLIPRGNPLDPLIAGAPNFPSAHFVFDIHLLEGLGALPPPGGSPYTTIASPAVATALPSFNALASLYQIDPSPPVATRPPGTQVQKYLPLSYQQAANYAPAALNWCSPTTPTPAPCRRRRRHRSSACRRPIRWFLGGLSARHPGSDQRRLWLARHAGGTQNLRHAHSRARRRAGSIHPRPVPRHEPAARARLRRHFCRG
jgi:hypothetical protein